MVKKVFVPDKNLVFDPSLFKEKDWLGVCNTPEYQNMKRLDTYVDEQAVGQIELTSSIFKISKPPCRVVPVTHSIATRARLTPSAIRI